MPKVQLTLQPAIALFEELPTDAHSIVSTATNSDKNAYHTSNIVSTVIWAYIMYRFCEKYSVFETMKNFRCEIIHVLSIRARNDIKKHRKSSK